MILAGQSAGAVAALRAAAESPEGLVAVLAFAADRLGEVFHELGAAVPVPVLLYYAKNDRYFGPAASRAWFARFQAGGGRAEYVLEPAFGRDGHFIFTHADGTVLWVPRVERFLAGHRIAFGGPRERF